MKRRGCLRRQCILDSAAADAACATTPLS